MVIVAGGRQERERNEKSSPSDSSSAFPFLSSLSTLLPMLSLRAPILSSLSEEFRVASTAFKLVNSSTARLLAHRPLSASFPSSSRPHSSRYRCRRGLWTQGRYRSGAVSRNFYPCNLEELETDQLFFSSGGFLWTASRERSPSPRLRR